MPDVGFRLFGDSSLFERAVSRSKGSIKQLDDDVKGAQKTLGGLARAAAPAAAIAGAFYKASQWARELRAEAEKSGQAIDSNVAAGARLADNFDALGKSIKVGFATAVGFVTKQLENAVYAISGLDGDAFRAEMENNEKRAKFAASTKASDEAIAKKRKEAAYAEADSNAKINLLFEDNLKLQKEMDGLAETDVKRNALREQIEENNLKIRAEDKKLQAESAKHAKEIAEAEKEAAEAGEKAYFEGLTDEAKLIELKRQILDLEDQQHIVGLDRLEVLKLEAAEQEKIAQAIALQKKVEQDRARIDQQKTKVSVAESNIEAFKKDRASMTLQELANISPFAVGVSTDTADRGAKAREILGLEGDANKRRLAGDVAGADELFSKADQMREAVVGKGGVKSSEGSATAALEKALAAELTELQEINKKFGGVVRSKK